jgi:hypothetical protein
MPIGGTGPAPTRPPAYEQRLAGFEQQFAEQEMQGMLGVDQDRLKYSEALVAALRGGRRARPGPR